MLVHVYARWSFVEVLVPDVIVTCCYYGKEHF